MGAEGNADVLTLCREFSCTANSYLDRYATKSSDMKSQHSVHASSAISTRPSLTSRAGLDKVADTPQSQRADAYEAALHAHITDLEVLASEKLRERAVID